MSEGSTYVAWGSDPDGDGYHDHVGIIYEGASPWQLLQPPVSLASPAP